MKRPNRKDYINKETKNQLIADLELYIDYLENRLSIKEEKTLKEKVIPANEIMVGMKMKWSGQYVNGYQKGQNFVVDTCHYPVYGGRWVVLDNGKKFEITDDKTFIIIEE